MVLVALGGVFPELFAATPGEQRRIVADRGWRSFLSPRPGAAKVPLHVARPVRRDA